MEETVTTGTTSEVVGSSTDDVTTGVVEDIRDDVNISIEELIAAEFEDDDIMGQEHSGLPNYNEILKHLPENGRKLIANLRSSYTRKTQELSAARKEIEEERAKLQNQTRLLTESSFAKNINDLASSDETNDIWDDEGRRNEIQKQAALMMQNMLKPLQEEVIQEKRRVQLESFKMKNPDLVEYRMDIAKMLMERPELKLEDAYHLVKARDVSSQAESVRSEASQLRSSRRDALKKTSTGRDVGRAVGVPKFSSAWEAYQYHRDQARNGVKD